RTSSVPEVGLRLDLHQHVWRDKAADSDECGNRANVAENLAMGFSDFFPVGDVGDEHTRADHILHRRASFRKRGLDVLEDLDSLGIGIANADKFSVGSSRGRTRNVNVVPYPDCARETDDCFVWRIACDVLSHHVLWIVLSAGMQWSLYVPALATGMQEWMR